MDRYNAMAARNASAQMPGAFPFGAVGAAPALGQEIIPAVPGSSDIHDGEYDWGYEPDRPSDGQG